MKRIAALMLFLFCAIALPAQQTGRLYAGTGSQNLFGTTNQITITTSGGTTTISLPSTLIAPGTIAATGGISSAADGVHAGELSLVGNTTAPSIASNTVNILGPALATFTAYGLQLPSTNPSSSDPFLSCGTPSSSISTCTWVANAGGNTTSTSLTTDYLPMANGANSIINSHVDDGATTSGTVTSSEPLAATSLSTTNDGTHPGNVGFPGNTTLPSLTSNLAYLIGPPAATFTAYSMQLPSAVPVTGDLLSCTTSSTNCLITDSGVLATNITTNSSNYTADGIIYATGNHTAASTAAGTSGQCLTSNGSGSAPTFQSCSGGSSGPLVAAITSKTSGYTLTSANGTVVFVCASTCTATLPTTSLNTAQQFIVKNGSQTIAVTLSSSVNIDFATSQTLTPGQSMTVQWDGSQYWIE